MDKNKKRKDRIEKDIKKQKAKQGIGFGMYRPSVQLSKKDKLKKRGKLKNEFKKRMDEYTKEGLKF